MERQKTSPMYSFSKTLRKAEHVRQYTIRSVETGWEVRAEQDSRSLHTIHYDDWHRVERAHRRMLEELEALTNSGWVEVRDVA
jgi:hypothetical protein